MPIKPIVLALALTLAQTGQAAPEPQFQAAFATFMQASEGRESAIAPAVDAFAALLQAEPANPVLLAYSGAATAMKANTTWLPWKKLGHAEDGLARLDKALALLTAAHDAPVQNGTPGVLEVKFVAASTFLAVPGFMNRHERGERLLGEVLASPLLAGAPLAFRGSVWLKAADEAVKSKQTEAARRYLNLLIQQQAPQAAQAQSQLKGLAS